MGSIDRIAEWHSDLTEIRRDIHAHPELGFEENRTSDIVAEKLADYGCEVHRGLGKTGVVGTLRVGNSTRSVGLRADMDALPILEGNSFAHRSTSDGKMHACGHDGHTTMLLGAARYLAETMDFDGQVHFIFQPAEEGIGGAQAMIADGLFQQFPCDVIYGMHNRPNLEVGKFAVRPGAMMAGGGFFDIKIEGIGGHGARPETGVDPVVVASQMVMSLQTIVSRNLYSQEQAVLSITQIHAGDAYNVIPQTAQLAGTVRTFSEKTMVIVEENMQRIVDGVAASFGAKAEFDFRYLFAPTVNTPSEAEFVSDICAGLVGEENVDRNGPLIMASEDFSWMLREVPGAYFNIGNGGEEGGCEVHNPGYDFNDEALPLGASAFVKIVETRLARED
ncbi:MAG: amidohydrolase [Rhodospirillaceae bacterium]|nr:amidohydrolase [Rhodospirillaceae bacterium]MBT5194476.1 amidohydrolase [Rhodospirillaceae bacterium]MBT5895220.1 amidohydrolase [Rhodospirillaceae bacterium]MBT6431025.1 amidohydrolase [Rhodospirillaceae bacterium]